MPFVWNRFKANAVDHVAGPDGQPICPSYLNPEKIVIRARPSGVADLCQRCQAKARKCTCMPENPGDGGGERVLTHSSTCFHHPEYDKPYAGFTD